MTQNLFWNLLAKKLSGEACPEELRELEQLMKEHPEWIYAAEHIESIWKLKRKEEQNYDTELAFEQHLFRLKDIDTAGFKPEYPIQLSVAETPKKSAKTYFLPAFTILILLVAGWVWNNTRHSTAAPAEKKYSEVTTRPGSRTMLVLPDSTVVWLNAGSRLTYNEHFGQTNRTTTLSGEAYFEVKKDKIPFVIHAGAVQIRVLGTIFNVKSYPTEKTTETSLIRGRVEITLDKRPGEKYILKPNEKLVVNNEPEETQSNTLHSPQPLVVKSCLTHSTNNTIIETSWVDNKLVFQDESFSDLARRLERWYGVQIEFRNEKLASERLSGTFTTETIQEALEELQYAIPFHFTLHSNEIIITK